MRVLAMFRYATKLIALKVKRCQVFPLIASGRRRGGEACLIYKQPCRHAMGVVDSFFHDLLQHLMPIQINQIAGLPFYYYVWCALICCVSKLSGWLFFSLFSFPLAIGKFAITINITVVYLCVCVCVLTLLL